MFRLKVPIIVTITATLLAATLVTSAFASAVPSPWASTDIGNTGVVGRASYNYRRGKYTIKGSGSDIWNTADAFHYVYQPLNGNGEVTARVVSQQNTDPWARAGVMIRESLSSNSREAIAATTPGNGISFSWRASTGADSVYVNGNAGSAPYWVRLNRTGNLFTAYKSANGTSWTKYGQQTISMGSSIYIGLAVSSHNNSTLGTDTFDNVSVNAGDTTAPTVPTGLAKGTVTTSSVPLTWAASTDNVGVTGYDILRNGTKVGSSTTPSYTDNTVSASTTYSYAVKAHDAAGNTSATSNTLSVTTPQAPPSSTAAAVISDSFGTGDDVPRGVPDGYSWKYDADNNPNQSWMGFKGYQALNTWCQIFTVQSGSVNYNVRVQATDPELYFFNGSQWTQATVPSGSPYPMGGAYWSGDFNPSGSADATIRNDGNNLYSVSLQQLKTQSDVFHFWWDGMFPRLSIPAGTQGIAVRTDMRLIPDNGYTGVVGAKFIASTDADLFLTPTTTTDPSGTNPGLPEARMKYVTGDWQHFYNTTLSEAVINAHPLPQ